MFCFLLDKKKDKNKRFYALRNEKKKGTIKVNTKLAYDDISILMAYLMVFFLFILKTVFVI